MRKRLYTGALAILTGIAMCGQLTMAAEPVEKILEKSNSGNPMLGFDGEGKLRYAGDPSILVDGDTVYCYAGNDNQTGAGSYNMPDWKCYSTKDLKNWKYESTIMSCRDINGATTDSAWASQVAKGSDGKYYFYYSTHYRDGNAKGIGVGVSDSPTGPFEDVLKKPLVHNNDTYGSVHGWEDIDPTIWIENDENGEEHRYLGWGNNRFFICELNEDMISIKDQDGNPDKLSVGYGKGNDIVLGQIDGNKNVGQTLNFSGHFYTEAPYYYRQQDENGNYYGKYYMFFACDWREQLAYATTDDIMSNEWDFGGILMEPNATCNTHHPAVFDFKGQTYLVYHDGSLPNGNGARRVACIEPLTIKEDGTIDPVKMTATGLTGTVSTITDYEGNYLSNESFMNLLDDAFYPIMGKPLMTDFFQNTSQREWELNPGKADKDNEAYVSIESNDKPGLYIAVEEKNGKIIPVLSQDEWDETKSNADELAADVSKSMTFRTLEGFAESGVTFESVKYPGYYLACKNGVLSMIQNPDKKAATFFVSTDKESVKSNVLKTVRFYTVGEELSVDDIRIQMSQDNGKVQTITNYTTNADEIDMSTTGTKTLKVSYEYQGENYTEEVAITVVDKAYRSK